MTISVARIETDVRERLAEEWEALALISFHGGPSEDIWYADLGRDDIESIRRLIQDAAVALADLDAESARLRADLDRAVTQLSHMAGSA